MSSQPISMAVEPQRSSHGKHSRKHRHSRRRRRRRRIIITVVAVIVLVVAAIATTAFILINQGKANMLEMAEAQVEVNESATSQDSGKTVTYKGRDYRLNENIVSLCIIGKDNDLRAPAEGMNGQADMIMVLAIDTSNGAMKGIVVPRDSMVDVNRNYMGSDDFADTRNMQICLAYAYGTDDESSSELVATAASRILYNVPIQYYYTVNMDGVSTLVDEVGGVALEPLESIPGTAITKGEAIKLNGQTASSYIRWRDTNVYGTALDRQARQQQFISALASKILTTAKGNPSSLIGIANTISSFSTTNLELPELSFLASVIAHDGVGSVDLQSLGGEAVHDDNSQWEQFILDKESVYKTVLDVYYIDEGSTFRTPSDFK